MSGKHRNAARLALLALMLIGILFPLGLAAEATPALPAWRMQSPWSTESATIRIGNETIEAEVADTSQLRSRGLGYRDGLRDGTGMLFVYDNAAEHSFWMKGMRFCLDIIWIEDAQIRGAAESVCPVEGVPDADLPRYRAPEPVRFVLEVPAGWMQVHGFGIGEPVAIDLP